MRFRAGQSRTYQCQERQSPSGVPTLPLSFPIPVFLWLLLTPQTLLLPLLHPPMPPCLCFSLPCLFPEQNLPAWALVPLPSLVPACLSTLLVQGNPLPFPWLHDRPALGHSQHRHAAGDPSGLPSYALAMSKQALGQDEVALGACALLQLCWREWCLGSRAHHADS